MQTSIYRCLLLCTLILGLTSTAWAAERSRKISKQFDVSASDKLAIDNRYGKVHVNTTAQGKITVDVNIIVRDGDADDLQKKLDRVKINIERSTGRIYFGTEIDRSEGFFERMLNWAEEKTNQLEVNYTVNMPAQNPLEIENQFGDVYLADFHGPLQLEVKYGTLRTERITSKEAYVDLSFGAGEIREMQQGKLDVKYSKMELEKCGTLQLDNSYSDLTLGTADQLNLDSRYGSVAIDEAHALTADIRYCGFSLGKLTQRLESDISYCPKFEIDHIAPGVERIAAEGEFSSIRLRFAPEAAGQFDVDIDYGNLRHSGLNLNFNERIEQNHSLKARGTFGGQSKNKSNITVRSRYGDVRLE
ncbi:hypothetical protein SAMN05421823_101144 [Catalinimonas alkaloidigena]|uniref:Uncharacterized protein n=1 Tax=Catalinimonas alkaloidigena TaxID=1075417 RepID=A0A1G8WPA0_9BACT|nr:hypothetical protein [Catalinimonas alkaloidigena]SDJ80104.1 hypothetical protein SAMN05421823_101144 [Catalinimonas alkaloidigena]